MGETDNHHKNGDLSDRMPHTTNLDSRPENSATLKVDNNEIIGTDAPHVNRNGINDEDDEAKEYLDCDLDCGESTVGGSCFLEKEIPPLLNGKYHCGGPMRKATLCSK